MTPISLAPEKDSSSELSMPGKSFPSVYLSAGKELLDLPEEGTITFKFDRKSLTVRDDSVELYLKLLSIENVTDESVEDPEETDELDGAKALDKLKAAMDDGEDE